MKRNFNGEPQPATVSEIEEALEEVFPGSDPEHDLYTIVKADEAFWYAEIHSGSQFFCTDNFRSWRFLRQTLQRAGFTHIEGLDH